MTPIGTATPGAAWFLEGVSRLQQQQTQTVRALTSGYKVQDASDAPSETQELVGLGASLAEAQDYQGRLSAAQTEAQAGDSAIGTAISLLQQAQTLASQGASSTATATTRQGLAAQISGIQQQIVGLADTTLAGRYIFGGGATQSPPYQYNSASPNGVDKLTQQTPGALTSNSSGGTIYQGLTAQQLFDASDVNGNAIAGNAFAALQAVQTSLSANDTAGIATAIDGLGAATDYLNNQQSLYGAAEQRINTELNTVANQITNLQTAIGGIRDTDVTQAATDLSQETINQSAAYGAESLISKKTLFDYLG